MLKTTSKTLLMVTTLALPLSLQAQCGEGKCGGAMKKIPKTTIAAHQANSEALTLLATMNMKESYEGMIKRITQMQIEANPELKAIEPAIKAFFTKFMGWEAQKGDIAALYAKTIQLRS